MNIVSNVNENIAIFKKSLNCDKNFDIVYRTIIIGEKTSCMFFIDGFAKDDIIEKIMESFYKLKKEDMPSDAHEFSKACVPYCEVSISSSKEDITLQILSGALALFIDGYDQCILIDSRTYPQRSTAEPDKDKVFRGSKDGFVETLILNTALIRRRIRNEDFCVEHTSIGRSSKTDIALCYISSRVDYKLLAKIKSKINKSNIDALCMNQESLSEILIKHKWYNPFPKFKYTERPDAAAAQILEGDVVILVDNSPNAMLLPATLFDIMEEANDYYFPPITGSYLRITRFIVTLLTVILTPTWLLLLNNPAYIPNWLDFIKIDERIVLPVIAQIIILEFVIDGLKLASLSTPNVLTTSLSMIGAIVLSDFAVKSGWFNAETMLYMAFVAIGSYSQPCLELNHALKFIRLILLVLTAIFGVSGYIGGLVIFIAVLALNKTVSGESYLYPLFPFNAKELKKKMLRIKIDNENNEDE